MHKSRFIPIILALSAQSALSQNAYTNFGEIGHVRFPSASMGEAGDTSFQILYSNDLQGQRLSFQPSPNLSLDARFLESDIWGAENTFNLKYRLLEEGAYTPSLAIGFNDMMGIGNTSAEYLALTKSFGGQSYGSIEATLGLGWGALAGDDALFSSGTRPAVDKHKFSTNHFFKGDASLYAGLNYHTPIKGLILSADYQAQTGNNFAIGLTQSIGERVVGSVQYEEDGSFGLAFTLKANPNKPVTPQDVGEPPLAVVPRQLLGSDMNPAWAANPAVSLAMGPAFEKIAEDSGARLISSQATASRISVQLAPANTLLTPKIIGRMTRALAMNAPGSVEYFDITIVNEKGVPVSTTRINRSQYEASLEQDNRNTLSFQSAQIMGATPLEGVGVYRTPEGKKFHWSGGISTNFDLFDGGGIRLMPYLNASYKLMQGLSINALASVNLYDTSTTLPATTAPERIRSDSALYSQDPVSLDRLTMDYHFKMGADLYGRASFGLLERQFAGLDTEFIYAPAQSPLAFGLDVAQVVKRDPENPFGTLDYTTTTGFATLYWDTGYNGIEASMGYGKFLGDDWGSELTLGRKFRNGWRVEGGLVIPEKFWDTEDTQDLHPSLRVSIPLQWSMPTATKSTIGIGVAGSSSDYGAKLNIANPLYPSIRDYDATDYELRWGSFWQ